MDLAGTLGAVALGVGKVTSAASQAGSAAGQIKQMSSSFKESGTAAQASIKQMMAFSTGTRTAMTTASSAVRNAGLARSMSSMMSSAYSAASSGLSSLKRLFSGTSFRLNHSLSLPHFSMHGSFNAQTHSVPSVSVSWYAKAAEYGALFSNPQIIGVGDAAQPELLIGTEKLKELVGGGTTINNFTFNVNGTDQPEQWADECVRQIKLKVRTT
jgi:Sec-independent protein translocase protein TatA